MGRQNAVWNKKKDDLLVRGYSKEGPTKLAEKLGFKVDAVKHRAKQLGLRRPAARWTAAEENYVISRYKEAGNGGVDLKGMAIFLGRTEGSVGIKARKLGLTVNHRKWTEDQRSSLKIALTGVKRKNSWSEKDEAFLRENYANLTRAEIGSAIGKSLGSVRSKCYKLRLNDKFTKWTDEEIHCLAEFYGRRDGKHLDLSELSAIMGRSRSEISSKAQSMGLAQNCRPISLELKERLRAASREAHLSRSKEQKEAASRRMGLVSKNIPTEVRSAGQKKRWAKMTKDERSAMARKSVNTRIEKYGTGCVRTEQSHSRSVKGRRADLGDRFYRSTWEANYARYLNKMVEMGKVSSWEHEPKRFMFKGAKSAPYSYMPDFRVCLPNGDVEWREVKGWFDEASRLRISKFRELHPDEVLVVIDSVAYKAIAQEWAEKIENWE